MRLLFAGTPEFAARALQALIAAGHEVVLVLSQPDRPAGRGMALHPSPVKQLALATGIEVLQPVTLRDGVVQARLAATAVEVMVVAAYGLILPREVLDLPRYGCINIHASLLPRWRGAAPIQRAILAGDRETGISIMQMDAGLDSGPVLLSASLPITDDANASSLHDALAVLGARLIVEALAQLPLPPRAQATSGVTYAAKVDKAEAALDWRLPARQLARQVRAFNPSPGAMCCVDGRLLKVWRALADEDCGRPGEVLAVDRNGVLVACGEGSLRLQEVQKPGGKRLPAAQFAAGSRLVASAGRTAGGA